MSLDRKSSTASLHSTPALTRASSTVSGNQGPTNTTAAGGLRLRQRSFTRFDTMRKDTLSARIAKFRSLSQLPHIGVDDHIVTEVIAPMLADEDGQLKFADNSGQSKIVVVTSNRLIMLAVTHDASRVNNNASAASSGAHKYDVDFSVPLSEIAVLYDSCIDEKTAFVKTETPVRLSQRDIEVRFVSFAAPGLRDRFEAHIVAIRNPDFLEVASKYHEGDPPLVTSGLTVVASDLPLKHADDVRKMLAAEAQKAGADAADSTAHSLGGPASNHMETCEADFLQVAHSREQFRSKLTMFGETKILFSSEVALSDNTHDIIVLCDSALYTGKMRKEHKLRYRVPYAAIEGVVVDSRSPQLVLKLDFSQVPKNRGDMTMTFGSTRNRDVFVSVLSSAFEARVIDRLPTSVEEDVFWAKRGLVESQLLRVVTAIKTSRFSRALGGDVPAPGTLSAHEQRSAKWLLYFFRYHTQAVISALSSAAIPPVELDFIARCTFAVFENCDWTDLLLRNCVQHALALRDGDTKARVALALCEPNSMSAAVLQHYVSQCGEQYVQVVLAQIIERFLDDPSSSQEVFFAAAVEEWLAQFVRSILDNTDGDILADELKVLIALVHDRSVAASRTGAPPAAAAGKKAQVADQVQQQYEAVHAEAVRTIGMFFYAKLIHPALTNPIAMGLCPTEPNANQSRSLRRVAFILQAMFCGATDTVTSSSGPEGADIWEGFGQLDRQQLARFAKKNEDAIRNCLKGLIFTDVQCNGRNVINPVMDSDSAFNRERGDAGVPLYVPIPGAPPAAIARQLAAHVDTQVTLSAHNPKLLHALCKATAPYYPAVVAHVAACSSSSSFRVDVRTGGGGTESATAQEVDRAQREAATARAEADNTVRQLTHEVLDLRRQLEQARAEVVRTTNLAVRLQEELALGGSSKNRNGKSKNRSKSRVTFEKRAGAKGPAAESRDTSSSSDESSSSSSSGSSGADSDIKLDRQKQGSVSSPTHRLHRSASGVVAVNPLPILRTANGLSPAMQEYHRSLQELDDPALKAIPAKSRGFGCPLDTYIIGRGPIQPPAGPSDGAGGAGKGGPRRGDDRDDL